MLGDSTSDLSGFNIVYAILAGMGGIFHAVCGHWILGDVEGCITPRPRQARCQDVETVKGLPEGGNT